MTEAQRKLARNALGLPNEKQCSYRNRYYSPRNPVPLDELEWSGMRDAGYAVKLTYARGGERTEHHYELTRDGAEAALLPGETLDKEDFPV